MYPQGRVVVSLNAYKSDPSYVTRVATINHYLGHAKVTHYGSYDQREDIVWDSPTFSLSRKPSISLFVTLDEVLLPLLLTVISYAIFLFIIPLDGAFSRRESSMVVAICWSYPLCVSSSSLFAFFVTTSIVFVWEFIFNESYQIS